MCTLKESEDRKSYNTRSRYPPVSCPFTRGKEVEPTTHDADQCRLAGPVRVRRAGNVPWRHGADRRGGAAATRPGRLVVACPRVAPHLAQPRARVRAPRTTPARLTGSYRYRPLARPRPASRRQQRSGAAAVRIRQRRCCCRLFLERRPHEQGRDGTPPPAWHLCWRRPGDRFDGWRSNPAPECVHASRRFVSSGQSPVPSLFNPLSKLLLQSYQSSQQLSYFDPGVRTVPIMTAQFLKIFLKKNILLGTD